jgi:hypothetical protein
MIINDQLARYKGSKQRRASFHQIELSNGGAAEPTDLKNKKIYIKKSIHE